MKVNGKADRFAIDVLAERSKHPEHNHVGRYEGIGFGITHDGGVEIILLWSLGECRWATPRLPFGVGHG